jgi:hypothetical protein
VVTTSLERRLRREMLCYNGYVAAGAGRSTPGEARTVGTRRPLEELIRVVNEAHGRDARDERRLYDPKLDYRPFFSQRSRPE